MMTTSASFDASVANSMLLMTQSSPSSSVAIAAFLAKSASSSMTRRTMAPTIPVKTRDTTLRKTVRATAMTSSISSPSLSSLPMMPSSENLVQASSSLLSPSTVTALIPPMQRSDFLVGTEQQKQKQQQQEQEQEVEQEVIRATTKAFLNNLDPLRIIPKKNSLRSALNLYPAVTTSRRHHHYGRRPWIVGHRGAPYHRLENTIESFLTSYALGSDAVELDVFLLPKDNTLVCFHGFGDDSTPGDLTNYCILEDDDTTKDDDDRVVLTGSTSIIDLSYEETQQLQFNTEFHEFPCASHHIANGRIPTLQEVLLDAKRLGKHVKIELKGPGTVEPVLELVDSLHMVHQCQFSSFHLDMLAQLRQLRPQTITTVTKEAGENQQQLQQQHPQYVYKTGALFDVPVPENFIQQAKNIGASEIHLRYDTCTKERIAAIHDAGLGSMAWFRGPISMQEDTTDRFWDVGNEDENMYQAVLDTGVQQMCVNKPDVLANMFSKQKQLEEQEEKKEERNEQEDLLILDVEKDLFVYVDSNPMKNDVFF